MKDLTLTLCEKADGFPKGDGFFVEPKLDGIRAVSIDGKIYNRKSGTNELNRDITDQFPEIETPKGFVLDGEIVGGEAAKVVGRLNLTDTFRTKLLSETYPCKFVVFDVLGRDGEDLRSLALIERKRVLFELPEARGAEIIESYNAEDGRKLWEDTVNNDGEGVVIKQKDAPYVGKRSPVWLKMKNWKEELFPILRYEITDKGGFVIVVPLPNGGEERVVVNDRRWQKSIRDKLDQNPPDEELPVAEIQYLEITENGSHDRGGG